MSVFIKNQNHVLRTWFFILLLEQNIDLDEIKTDWSEAGENHVFNYFATEVLQQIDDSSREFLLKSALLPKMNIAICRELTGIGSARNILSDLAHRQFFTLRHGLLKASYEYHPLFREFLLSRAQNTYSEHEFKQLQEMNSDQRLNKGLDLIHQIFTIYTGAFLQRDTDAPWSLSLRERLRHKFLRQLDTLGNTLCDHQFYEQAMVLYQQGLDVDDLAESIYQGIMRCCLQLDKKADGMVAYQRCRQNLHKRLDVNLSGKTEKLRAALQA